MNKRETQRRRAARRAKYGAEDAAMAQAERFYSMAREEDELAADRSGLARIRLPEQGKGCGGNLDETTFK